MRINKFNNCKISFNACEKSFDFWNPHLLLKIQIQISQQIKSIL